MLVKTLPAHLTTPWAVGDAVYAVTDIHDLRDRGDPALRAGGRFLNHVRNATPLTSAAKSSRIESDAYPDRSPESNCPFFDEQRRILPCLLRRVMCNVSWPNWLR